MTLSKVYDVADLPELTEELAVVDRHWDGSQHASRRWEYALALRAFDTWAQADYEHYGHANRTHGGFIYDVGGAGSPFYHMIGSDQVRVIDPKENQRLDQAIRYARLGSAVFCLSVIEHVEDLDQFLYHLSCLVAPGGLLFLTTDYQPEEGPDNKHWSWMRTRIFTPDSWYAARVALENRAFTLLGEQDATWHGPIENWGYAPASLALVKRR